jgi:hypothetical protein
VSGSFAPNLGFTYDQQSAPSSPSRGQTWRERDSNNDFVQDWFWNGTYWLSTREYIAVYNNGTATLSATSSANPVSFAHTLPANIFVKDFTVSARVESASSPGGAIDTASSYWTFDVLTITAASSAIVSGAPTLSMQNGTWSAFYNLRLDSTAINTFITNTPTASVNNSNTVARSFGFTATKAGSASNLTRVSCVIRYQLARA